MQPPQGRGHTAIESSILREPGELGPFAGQLHVQFALAAGPARGGVQRRQTGAVGKSEKAIVIVPAREGQAGVAGYRRERGAMKWFGVREDPVEVEQDRARGHRRHQPLDTPEPARLTREDMVVADNAPATILVVDDEAAVVQSVTALLELETPHKVLGETSPQRAINLAKINTLDLVISDFLMPEIDGIRLLLEIRGLYPESALILLTGYADKENAIRAINEVGIFHYMEKPWDNDDLLTIIRTGLDKRMQLHRLHERVRELEARVQRLQQLNRELEQRLAGTI